MHGFVRHHELLGEFSLWSGLVVYWCILDLFNHQAACVPKVAKRTYKEGQVEHRISAYICTSIYIKTAGVDQTNILLLNDFICVVSYVGQVGFHLKVHTASL